jgi:anti-anti-sigma factor
MDITAKRACENHTGYFMECAHCRAENFGPRAEPWAVPPRQLLGEFRIQVLRLRGELTAEDALKVRNKINELLRLGRVHIILDLHLVPYLAAPGVPVLAERARHLRLYGGDVKMINLGDYTRHALVLAGAGATFDLTMDEPAAVRAFQNRA